MNTLSTTNSVYRQKKNNAKIIENINYTFKIIGNAALTVPTTVNGYSLINNGVTAVQLSRGAIALYFNGNSFLYMDITTPTVCTKTFWVRREIDNQVNNVFSSSNHPTFFDNSIFLQTSVNFLTGGGANILSTISQKSTDSWKFYAITMSATKTSLYVDGNLNAEANVNWIGDTSRIYFGAFEGGYKLTGWINDIRLYPTNLTPLEIRQLYIITKDNY